MATQTVYLWHCLWPLCLNINPWFNNANQSISPDTLVCRQHFGCSKWVSNESRTWKIILIGNCYTDFLCYKLETFQPDISLYNEVWIFLKDINSWFKINCIEVWDTFARDWMELCEFIRWSDLAFRIQCTLLRKETWEAYTWMTAFLTLNTPLDSDLVSFFPYGTRSVPNCNRYKVSVKWKQITSFLLTKHFSAFLRDDCVNNLF